MTDVDVDAARQALIACGLAPGATTLPLPGLTLRLVPRDASLQAKDIPVDQLFVKVTAMRDKLRVLEQRVNADPALDDAGRAALQAEVTATASALTGLLAFFSAEALPAPQQSPQS
jgi:hypothetical protein